VIIGSGVPSLVVIQHLDPVVDLAVLHLTWRALAPSITW
jgi:hypothetical protein